MKAESNHTEKAQAPSPVDEPSASEVAAARIRQGIVAGEFCPGKHLSERELCEVTGVSRAAVRESIRTLASEGLINVVRHRGPIVAQLTEKEARDLYDMRALLEGHCAALFVRRASEGLVTALTEAIEDIGRGHNDGNMVGVIDASQRFYEVLAEGANNSAISKTLETLHNRMALFRFSSTRWPGRAERSMAELWDIAAAVIARDATQASAAARIHVDRAAEMALLIIDERNRATGALLKSPGGRR